ncbi:MAG TPA: transporter suffix domain-containing protein, partial [Lachnospiraceae bacterium]|nr:transporter suffix domain-containing protein [Lachnospiraceae bacterium]
KEETLLNLKNCRINIRNHGELEKNEGGEKTKKRRKLAIIAVILSFLLYALLPVVGFIPISIKIKTVLIPSMMVISEILFWVGGAILGKDVISKYKRFFNPCNWFCSKTKG